jgi:hypothetical protein
MHPDSFNAREPKVGDAIVFHDSKNRPHNALVTVIYSTGCVNAVYVSGDETRQDSYGRQIERTATCMHKSINTVHGNYWRWESEQPNQIIQPTAS